MLEWSIVIIFAFVFINLIIRFSGYSSINEVLASESTRSRYANVDISYRTIERVVFRILNSPVLGESGLVHSRICHSPDAYFVDWARCGIEAKLFVNIGRTSALYGVYWASCDSRRGYQVVIVALWVSLCAYQILIHNWEFLRRHSFLSKRIRFHLSWALPKQVKIGWANTYFLSSVESALLTVISSGAWKIGRPS